MKRSLIILSILTASVVGACGYDAAQPAPPIPSDPGPGGGNPGGGNPGGGNPGGGGNQPPLTGDALVQKECGRCHQPGGAEPSPQIRTISEFKRAGGAKDVRDGSMPPDKRLDNATKSALLAL